MDKKLTPDEVIDALGGTSKVAEICEITDPAISQWRTNGIPKAQLKFLRLAFPDVFASLERPLLAESARRVTTSAAAPTTASGNKLTREAA